MNEYERDAKRALGIAKRKRTWREAIREIIANGLADDVGEADELIREGERLESLE